MAKKDKIAVFGGTFNPPHNGHVHLLEAFQSRFDFQSVIILPTAVPPHKRAYDLAAGEHRLAMCRLAFPDCEVSDYEITRGGKNYTADTLEYLKTLYPQAQLYFIMGTDMFVSFCTWRDPERILQNAVLLCDARDESLSAQDLERFGIETLGLREEQFVISDVKPLPLSSSEIRQKIKSGESVEALLPEGVAAYIRKEGLYA